MRGEVADARYFGAAAHFSATASPVAMHHCGSVVGWLCSAGRRDRADAYGTDGTSPGDYFVALARLLTTNAETAPNFAEA